MSERTADLNSINKPSGEALPALPAAPRAPGQRAAPAAAAGVLQEEGLHGGHHPVCPEAASWEGTHPTSTSGPRGLPAVSELLVAEAARRQAPAG